MDDHNIEYKTARNDMAEVIAQETSGLVGAIPEQDDYDLADAFIRIINGNKRHSMPRSVFISLVNDLV